MDKKLPARPHLDHLRREAKTLLATLKAGDPAAARVFIEHLPSAARLTIDGVRGAGFRLADAQAVVARKSGFASWPRLARHVEQLRALEGNWGFTSLEVEGTVMAPPIYASSSILIDGDRFRSEMPEAVYEGVFNIDVETSPHHIDIEFVEGPEAGNRSYGVYQLRDDALSICLGLTGAARPSGFATAPGSGHALETLARRRDGGAAAASPNVPDPVAGGPTTVDSHSPVFEPLAGEWQAVSVIRDAEVPPPAFIRSGRRALTGNHTRVTFGSMVILDCPTLIDAGVDPWTVDYLHTSGAHAGQVQRGTARLRDGTAEFCMAAPGQPRPAAFVSERGSGWTLTAWRRRS